MAIIHVCLLPKPQGGDWPIAICATAARWLSRWLRRQARTTWAPALMRPYIYGVTGRDVTQAVWRHS
eukprot:9588245-Prorocentrum_lima.AAC.1